MQMQTPQTLFALPPLHRFQHDLGCNVLLADESASVGLDLSFVSFVILCEPIENKSLEEQVCDTDLSVCLLSDCYPSPRPLICICLVFRWSAEPIAWGPSRMCLWRHW
jgi:hypothetical protein